MKLLGKILLAFYLLVPLAGHAVPVETDIDPKIEPRYRALIAELRCLVCQNQSLADSDAELAQDLRREVLEMMEAGKSDQEIVDFLVNRYGDFVLYRPPVRPETAVLWVGPFLLLVAVAGGVLFMIRRRAAASQTPALTEEDRKKVQELLRRDPTESDS